MRKSAALGRIKHAYYAPIVKVVSRAFSGQELKAQLKDSESGAFHINTSTRHSVHFKKGLAQTRQGGLWARKLRQK
jgi:hypothetical protein